jgi:DNA replication protein DnaC
MTTQIEDTTSPALAAIIARWETKQTIEPEQSPQSAYAAYAERKSGDDWSEIENKLSKNGFPARHIARLEKGLYGESEAKAAQLWSQVRSGDCLILLYGDRGPGKTQIATVWAHKRIDDGLAAGKYIKLVDLLGEIRATWHDGGRGVGTETDILRKYRTTKYLVIDECAEIAGKEWETRYLTNIIDHRYDSMLATILISNATPETIRDHIPASILDRATETGGLVHCDWESYRGREQ